MVIGFDKIATVTKENVFYLGVCRVCMCVFVCVWGCGCVCVMWSPVCGVCVCVCARHVNYRTHHGPTGIGNF